MMNEILKPINGWDDYYISNDGRVFNKYFNRYLKPGKIDDRGYMRVTLSSEGKSKQFLIHRLVAEAFCQKPEGCNVVHHKDNNPSNNRYDNLIWCTQSYNVKKAYEDGMSPSRKGDKNPNYKNGKYTKQNI